MIKSANKYYHLFAQSLSSELPASWREVRASAIYYSDGSSYRARYFDKSGTLFSMQFPDDLYSEIDDFRDEFANENKPLWGTFLFVLHSSGKFSTKFDYEDCDENGNKVFDEDTDIKQFELMLLNLQSP